MGKPKYTPGEWWATSMDEIVAMPSQVKISNCISGATPEEATANAKLASAAPDLLEAILAMRELGDRDDEPSEEEFMKVDEMIERAIKKAQP